MSEDLLGEEFRDRVLTKLAEIQGFEPDFKFALIGSRDVSEDCLTFMYNFSVMLLETGGYGYSGGAEGPDEQLTKAVYHLLNKGTSRRGYELAAIYAGWFKFNGLIPGDADGAVLDGSKQPKYQQARQLAQTLHPAFDKMGGGGQTLHTRNCFQILTDTLADPVDVVFYAASKNDARGRPLGGTATAWKLAQVLNIECFDLATKTGQQDAIEWIRNRVAGNKTAEDIFNKYEAMLCTTKQHSQPKGPIVATTKGPMEGMILEFDKSVNENQGVPTVNDIVSEIVNDLIDEADKNPESAGVVDITMSNFIDDDDDDLI